MVDNFSNIHSNLLNFFIKKWGSDYFSNLGWIDSNGSANEYIIFPRYTHRHYRNLLKIHTREQLDLFILEFVIFKFWKKSENSEFVDYLEIRFYDTSTDIEKINGHCVFENINSAEIANELVYIIHFATNKIYKINPKYCTKRYRSLPNISTLKRMNLIK